MKNIKIVELSKKYGDKIALNDISIELKSGEVLGIVGPNGSGKTTLMSIISGLRQSYDGEIFINGNNIKNKRNIGRKTIGCMLEAPGLYPNLTGYQNLDYFSSLIGKNQEKNIPYLVEKLMLNDFIDKKVKKYSLGMKQRLGLAIAMLGEPDFLILDEPTNGLDPEITPKIRDVIEEYSKKNIGIMVSSHNLSEIETICSRVLILKKGELIDEFMLNNAENKKENNNFIIETDDNVKLKTYLMNNGYLVSEIDDSLIVMLSNSDSSLLVNKLVKTGFKIYSISPYKQSLENRFLNVIEEGK